MPGATFAAHEVDLHGHHSVYREAGSGPNLVLIHGMINSSRHWEGVAERLADSYRVIAPDLIGHGDSATPRKWWRKRFDSRLRSVWLGARSRIRRATAVRFTILI